MRTSLGVAVFLFALPLSSRAATIPVADDAGLSAALAAVVPGDTIVLADGSYAGFTATRSGTADALIVIRAANPGGATIASGVIRLSGTSYLTVAGLTVTTPGGTQTIDGESIRVAFWFEGTDHCRLTRSRFALSGQARDTQWVLLSGNSQFNRVDHNELGPNAVRAHLVWPRGRRTIDGVTPPEDRTPWAEGQGPLNPNMARHTRIDHNHFHDQAAGTGETIVLGGLGVTGDYQDTFTTIEHNLFENCDGDAESISVKASRNVIRYNTIRTSIGAVSLRAGNQNLIAGNFLLQGLKPGSSGIKMQEKDHRVFNNYIEGSSDYPIFVGDGNAYDLPGFSHAQTFRAWVVNNTVVDGQREVRVGRTTRPLPPTDCIFANNLLVRFISDPDPLYRESGGPVNLDRAGNLAWPLTVSQPGFTTADPLLSLLGDDELQRPGASSPVVDAGDTRFLSLADLDMDGQARSAAPDVGADELSADPVTLRPLHPADVGPGSAPDIVAPGFDPPGGQYPSPQRVTIASATPGVSIRYTTDGSEPSATDGILYIGPVLVDWGAASLKAVAFGSGLLDSVVAQASYAIVDLTPPALTLPPALTVEAGGPEGAVVTFTATAVDDRDGAVPVTLTPPSGTTFPLGTTVVTATATDAAGNTSTGTFDVTVRDTTPPRGPVAFPWPPVLLFPNHRMVPVRVFAFTFDTVDTDPSVRIVSVTSSEPVSGTGPGDLEPDWEITGSLTVNLRAERAPRGPGRLYTLTVESRDFSGNASTRPVFVIVPR